MIEGFIAKMAVTQMHHVEEPFSFNALSWRPGKRRSAKQKKLRLCLK
jgi:hypothetical protein